MATAHTVQTWEELESFRAFWEERAHHPNAGYHLFCEVLRRRPEVLRPHILVVNENTQIQALVLCRLEQTRYPISIGYTRFGYVNVRTLVVMREGVLGSLSTRDADLAMKVLRAALDSGMAERIQISGQRRGHPLTEAALRLSGGWRRGFVINCAPHWVIHIPSKPGEFLSRMKSKHRNWLRRMKRELEARFGGSVVYVCYTHPEDLRLALRDVETVARKTYQRGLGVGVRNDDEHLCIFREAAEFGRLRIWVLYAGGQPRAYRIGHVYSETIYGGGIGYDPELKDLRIGTLLLIHAIDQLSQEGVQRYDLGLGDAGYKRQFGSESWEDLHFNLFANTIRGQFAKVAICLPEHLNCGFRRLLERLGLLDPFKKFFRSRMSRESNDEE